MRKQCGQIVYSEFDIIKINLPLNIAETVGICLSGKIILLTFKIYDYD